MDFSDLARGRKVPPSTGWRRGVHALTFGAVNLGKSKAERHWDNLEARIRRDVKRRYVIAVLSPSGSGATTLTAAIGETFKLCRPKGVIGIDADPGFGTLARRVAELVPGDIGTLLRETEVEVFNDIKPSLTVSEWTAFEVLAGDRGAQAPRTLRPEMFDQVVRLLARTAVHEVVLVDCPNDLEHPVMQAILREAQQLVFVAGLTPAEADPIRRAVEWLKNANLHHMVTRSMVILNDYRGTGSKAARAALRERFETLTGSKAIEDMWFDPYLSKGGIIDVKNELDKDTRLRLYEITAKLADLYVPETGRPPGYSATGR